MICKNKKQNNLLSALLVIGSALCLFSCKGEPTNTGENQGNIITQTSDSLTIIKSKDGLKDNRFYTNLLERYELAKEPYMEFRKGVKIETFNKETEEIETTFISDYAIYYETQELWEAKGNVVAVNAQGQVLETQQLFWNQKTHRIYSNVDSKITQSGDIIIGEGFESDESMEDFTFRKPKGKVALNIEPTQPTDSLEVSNPITSELAEPLEQSEQSKQSE